MDKIKKAIKNWGYSDWFGVLFLLAAIGMLVCSVRLCFSDGIWYDELYTMGLADRSYRQLTALTARDVHPPFYYYYVKTVQGLCRAVIPGINVVVAGKICSVLPLAGLFVYGVTKVRRHFGLLCAGLFVFCTVSMPSLPQYTVEIRMYTLSMFLVTAAFLHGYEIVCGGREGGTHAFAVRRDREGESYAFAVRRGRERGLPDLAESAGKGNTAVSGAGKQGCGAADWICLAVYGILAAYTHYFACVAVAMIYFSLLVFFLYGSCRAHGDRGKKKFPWKGWLAAAAFSILAYLPWMAVAARQVAQVKENYWILPLTWRIFGSCVKFLMKPQFGSGGFQVAAAVLLFVLYVTLFVYILWKNRADRKLCFVCMAGTGILAGAVLFGFTASFLIRPIFITRYMLPAAGCFWLSFAVFVSRAAKERKILIPVLCFVLAIGIGDFRWFRNDETWRRVKMEEVQETLALIHPGDIVVTQFNQVQGVTGYYLENKTYLWDSEPEELLCDIIENKYETITSAEQLGQYLEDGIRVWFIGNRNSDLLEKWEQEGIRAREYREVMLEVYWVSLYGLTK